jgi:flagellar biosynthetic protein FliR
MGLEFIALPQLLLQRIDVAWTFLLLLIRFTGMMMTCPGLGMGMTGVVIRAPAIMVISFAALVGGQLAALPGNNILAAGMLVSELLFGVFLGLLPQLAIAGIQTSASICSTSMGLQASQLIDPTLQVSVPDLARIFGDLAVLIFISLGGHYAIVYAAAGMGGTIVPGSFIVSEKVIELLVDHTAEIFKIGVLFSAPVVVALLITNVQGSSDS